MQRVLLFSLLVIAIPFGVFWASHGFEGPGATLGHFSSELRSLKGEEPPRTPPSSPPETPPKVEEPPKEVQETPPPPEPTDERALSLFREGEFEGAARAYEGVNEEQRALAELGSALAKAFPKNVPDLPYLVAESSGGSAFEGFMEEVGDTVRLTDPGGRSLSLPQASLHSRTVLTRAKAIERMEAQIREEVANTAIGGTRLFALLQRAFAIGRPDLAAPLLARAMALDEEEHYFLSGVRNRAPEAHQGALYRAYSACQLSKAPPVESVAIRTPTQIGEGRPRKPRGGVKDARARDLMTEASPLRADGEELYRTIAMQEPRTVKVSDIDEAIRLLDKAAKLYEEAMGIEDSDEINALLRHSSKLLYTLRFWKQQVEGR